MDWLEIMVFALGFAMMAILFVTSNWSRIFSLSAFCLFTFFELAYGLE